MQEIPWTPIAGINVAVERAANDRTGEAFWREGKVVLALPGRLSRQEQIRFITLLTWGIFGQAKADAIESLARQLNDRYFHCVLHKVRFHHQARRWGSCTSRRHIYLSHRLLVAPQGLLEAVLLHELAHLDCLDHSKRFWGILAAADPFCRRRRAELGAYGLIWAAWWSDRIRELQAKGKTCIYPPAFNGEGFMEQGANCIKSAGLKEVRKS